MSDAPPFVGKNGDTSYDGVPEFHFVGGVLHLCHEDDHYCPTGASEGGGIVKTRIEFTAFVDVDTDEPMTDTLVRTWVRSALHLGDKQADRFTSTLDDVTRVSLVSDNE